MTRCAILDRKDMSAEQGQVYDAAKAAGAPVGGPYWALIRNPKLMQLNHAVSNCLRDAGLAERERMIAVLTAIRHWGAKYPWAVQVRAALAAGLDQATIDTINARKTPSLADPREKAVHAIATELLSKGGLSDATYANAEKLFGLEKLVAVVATIGYFSMVCCTANAFDITPPDDAPGRLAG